MVNDRFPLRHDGEIDNQLAFSDPEHGAGCTFRRVAYVLHK
jgi:hypothetical protein